MATSTEKTRESILNAASDLYDEHGFSGVSLRDIATEAGVSTRTVTRHFPEINQLFAEVVARKARSAVADRLARQAREGVEPPMGVLLWAAREVFAAPERNWGPLELEAFIAARRDDEIAELVRTRLTQRWSSMDTVVQQMRAVGAIDDNVDDDAIVHFTLALSLGLALLDPVAPKPVGEREWTALMARLLTALGPPQVSRHEPVSGEASWRLRVEVPDRVGAVEQLARALTTVDAFVINVSTPGADTDGWRIIDLVVACPAAIGAAELRDTVASVGRRAYVREGSPDEKGDIPTRVLDGVTHIVDNPRSAPEQVAALVEADSFEVTDATTGSDDDSDVLRLQWTPTRHVVLRRSWAPFIRAEQARASAAMRLATAMAASSGDLEAAGWVEPLKGGGTAWMRLARPEDTDAVTAMHERCSERTIHQRYFRNITEWRELTMRRLAGGHRGASIVVMAEDGRIVGLGNVFPVEANDGRAAELALLVDDEHQALGIGGRLLQHMLELADRLGFDHVVASVLADNKAMVSLLERTGLQWSRHVESGVTEFSAPLN